MNAEQLQEHENRGYALAKAWLALGEHRISVRSSLLRLCYDQAGRKDQPYVALSAGHWRSLAKDVSAAVSARLCATMAGCELAIEQWEAAL